MTDPETIIIKCGIVLLALLAVLRLVIHEFNRLKDEWRKKR